MHKAEQKKRKEWRIKTYKYKVQRDGDESSPHASRPLCMHINCYCYQTKLKRDAYSETQRLPSVEISHCSSQAERSVVG